MADNSIQEYLEARAACDSAVAKVERLVNPIKAIADALDNWAELMFSNVKTTPGFPGELMSAPSINASNWPSVDALAQAIVDYHQARRAMDNAWRRVPQEMQGGLQPPPDRPTRTRRARF